MPRVVEHLFAGAHLHDVAGVHDGDAVRHIGYDAQVVGDVDGRKTVFFLQVADELQDLGLDRNVQGRGGLIADEDLGVAGHGDGDDDSLAHAAGELVGILLGAAFRFGNAYVLQDLHRLFAGRFAL